ncbi:MAG: ribonuclease III [Alphaproteobacteria bacterium]
MTRPGAGAVRSGVSDSLFDALDYRFADPALIIAALTHVSLRHGTQASAYQRLEFLGDRVLGVIVADMLYHRFPDESEGAMAKRHAALVRREALADVALRIGLATHIRVASPDANQDLLDNQGVLADCCEAVIAALYLDGGLEAARRFVETWWEPLLTADLAPPRDPKTALQEWAQGRGLPLPSYTEVERTGPDHAPVFVVEVSVQGLPTQQGRGPSKRVATRLAAERMLALAEPAELPR